MVSTGNLTRFFSASAAGEIGQLLGYDICLLVFMIVVYFSRLNRHLELLGKTEYEIEDIQHIAQLLEHCISFRRGHGLKSRSCLNFTGFIFTVV